MNSQAQPLQDSQELPVENQEENPVEGGEGEEGNQGEELSPVPETTKPWGPQPFQPCKVSMQG